VRRHHVRQNLGRLGLSGHRDRPALARRGGLGDPDHLRTELVTAALDMALAHRVPAAGVIFHSDHGTQYTSREFAEYCTNNGIRRSLGRTGICYDNAVSESFFATYKKELIHTRPWPSVKYLKKETFDWIETYYNTQRRHSTLGYLTPREYELGYREISHIAA
jgi:putative transposase